jgi:hypothetical protein
MPRLSKRGFKRPSESVVHSTYVVGSPPHFKMRWSKTSIELCEVGVGRVQQVSQVTFQKSYV